LYIKGGAPEADTNQNQSIPPQLSTLGFRALSPVVADDSNISNAVYAATQSDTQEQSRTTGVEAAINGTQLMSFVTRDGTEGLLQLANDIEDGSSVRVRYKLLEKEGSSGPPGREAARMRLRESLEERLEAAGSISGSEERGKAFARVAMDAARAGEPDIVETALQSVNNMSVHDQTALDAVRVLAKRHLRRQGIAIARNIFSNEMRDRALAELAQ
jgi:hypothetical protein